MPTSSCIVWWNPWGILVLESLPFPPRWKGDALPCRSKGSLRPDIDRGESISIIMPPLPLMSLASFQPRRPTMRCRTWPQCRKSWERLLRHAPLRLQELGCFDSGLQNNLSLDWQSPVTPPMGQCHTQAPRRLKRPLPRRCTNALLGTHHSSPGNRYSPWMPHVLWCYVPMPMGNASCTWKLTVARDETRSSCEHTKRLCAQHSALRPLDRGDLPPQWLHQHHCSKGAILWPSSQWPAPWSVAASHQAVGRRHEARKGQQANLASSWTTSLLRDVLGWTPAPQYPPELIQPTQHWPPKHGYANQSSNPPPTTWVG